MQFYIGIILKEPINDNIRYGNVLNEISNFV